MKRTSLLGLGLLTSLCLYGQDPVAQKYGALITASDLKENLSILASDAMEGRETGKRGQKMAAAFISSTFEELGLSGPVNGSYYQPVELFTTAMPKTMAKTAQGELTEFTDYTFVGGGQTDGVKDLSLVFAGKGTDEDLAAVDVKDKAVVIFLDANASLRNNPVITKLREKGVGIIIAVTDKEEEYTQLSGMIKMYSGGRISLTNKPSANLGTFIMGPGATEKLFKTPADKLKKLIADKKISKVKAGTFSFSVTQSFNPLKSMNVLGYMEGTDKKDEVLVITAHYDHIGMSPTGEGDRINNGADDDGSGTVSVLQLAKAFAQAKKDGKGPRRSILFMTVTGEEKGLLGSEYYSEHPIFPLDKTVVDLNIDMVGRRDPQHKDSAPYVYVIGADKLSTELNTLSEANNKIERGILKNSS